MHEVNVKSLLTYTAETPTTLLLNVAITTTPRQRVVAEELNVDPVLDIDPLPVGEEENRFHRVQLQPGETQISYQARAQLEPFIEDPPTIDQIEFGSLPPQVLSYLNPSRYCESDRLSNFALAQFGTMPANFERVDTVCNCLSEHLEYKGGSTNALPTACDVLVQRQGVCRDFAHLAISFCRALGVPARYVSGYACLLEPPDFHGFFEAYLDGRWYIFDPTRLAPPAGLVRIGTGRDAADTAFATVWGKATLDNISVQAWEVTGEEGLLDEGGADIAVSTA